MKSLWDQVDLWIGYHSWRTEMDVYLVKGSSSVQDGIRLAALTLEEKDMSSLFSLHSLMHEEGPELPGLVLLEIQDG